MFLIRELYDNFVNLTTKRSIIFIHLSVQIKSFRVL